MRNVPEKRRHLLAHGARCAAVARDVPPATASCTRRWPGCWGLPVLVDLQLIVKAHLAHKCGGKLQLGSPHTEAHGA